MSCPDEDVLLDLAHGQLSPERAGLVREHIEGCSACLMAVGMVVAQSKEAEDQTSEGPRVLPPLSLLDKGTAVGRYEVRSVLGLGAMGVVYLAWDPELERQIAIKVLRPTVHGARGLEERLRRESKALAKLRHPNVVAVHDVGSFRSMVFVAMEYVEGATLRRWLAHEPRRPAQIVEVFVQAGLGLSAAHRAGLVHRDFKPDNVMIDREGRACVTDFGLARSATVVESEASNDNAPLGGRDALASPAVTTTGARVGTPAYMAPEQIEGLEVGPAADQFAFGVALYEALYGARPFAGSTMDELFANIAAGRIRNRASKRGTPSQVQVVLRRALSVAAADRYPSMTDLVAELEHNPAARRRAWALVGIATLAVGGTVGGRAMLRARAVEACMLEADPGSVWNEQARASLREGLLVHEAYGAEAFDRVAPVIDAYTAKWSEVRERTCLAREVEHALADADAAARTLCLQERLDTLRQAVERLDSAARSTVERAPQVVQELPAVADCEDPVYLARHVAPRLELPSREEIDAARSRLARIRIALNAGAADEARTEAQALLGDVAELDNGPLRAEVVYELGMSQRVQGEYEASRRSMEEAFYLAMRARDDERAAHAATVLIDLTGRKLSDPRQGEQWGELAASLLARLEHPVPRIEVYRLRNLGLLAASRGRHRQALALYDVALALTKAELGAQHPVVSSLLNNIAMGRFQSGQTGGGIEVLQQAIELRSRDLGSGHPELLPLLINLGNARQVEGDLESALHTYDEAAELAIRTRGADHAMLGMVEGNRAWVHADLGHPQEAMKAAKEALRIHAAALPAHHPRVRASRIGAGTMALVVEEPEVALEHADAGLATYGADDEQDIDRIELRLLRARALRHLDRPAEAHEMLPLLVADLEGLDGTDPVLVGRVYTELGRTTVALGDREAGIAALEQGIARLPKDGPPDARAEATFALVKVLGDSTRSKQLVRQTREDFVAAGPAFAASVAEVDQWARDRDPTEDP